MSINHQTLKCGECGSGVLERTGLNQYRCAHCGSVSVVEDQVSERLDRVLEQVKDAAAERLAREEAARRAQSQRTMAIVISVMVAAGVLLLLLGRLWNPPAATQAASAPRPVFNRSIPTEGLKLVDARQVLVGSGSSARPKLFVLARNETGQVLESPRVEAHFFDGENRLGSRSERLPLSLMLPGESLPFLMDLPGERNVTRQEFKVAPLSAPSRAVQGPRLPFERVRLVQQGRDLRFVARVANPPGERRVLSDVRVLVTAYDEAGAPIAIGRAYAQAAEIRPGERSTLEARLERFGGDAGVAAWDWRVDHQWSDAEGGTRTAVIAADRVQRVTGAPERFNERLRMSTADLLAEDSERFDLAQLELLPLIPGLSTIRQRTYMTELVNRSKDRIAIAPAAVISRYDGNRLDGSTQLDGVAYLYPGERLPVQVDPQRADRITQTRVEWKPLRGAPLPGPRQPLEVQVSSTEAQVGSVLLNFSQRFSYKAVNVKGQVRNPGTAIVRKARLWVSLRDRNDRLTGFKQVDNLPAIGPGESVPFEVRIEQQGADFASVSTLYQSTE
ncbi:FxLYD domain-containing protein [Xenophilus arseniciresistens]|uniref:FxLYD domain-containing protein n=1 Tax=Xenophilus arseniciresistens TaxID=1283306 RepID=A0AAE3NFB1_9BURK|nr:FxLYD domain-containing protein [Xenophilus arseniciresistens]MDA7419232.1 FxLYD domain-containing protein [Xenophilus arseniciresistens]